MQSVSTWPDDEVEVRERLELLAAGMRSENKKSGCVGRAEVGTREQLNIHSTSGWCNFEIPPRANTQPHTTLKAWPRSPDGVERRPGADPDEALPARVDGGTRGVVW